MLESIIRVWEKLTESNKAQARTFLNYLLIQQESGPAEEAVPVKTPFSDYIEKWFNLYKTGLAKTTVSFYLAKKRRLLKAFGEMYIEDITPDDVQRFISERSATCSKKTVHHDLATLRDVMNSAVADGLIQKNPAKDHRIHNSAPLSNGTDALKKEQIAAIQRDIPTLADPVERCLIALLAYTSMRREEVLGLKWENVDFRRNIIRIERAVVYAGGHMYEKGTKTEKSVREFPMVPELRRILRECRQKRGYVVYGESADRPIESYNRYDRLWKSLRSHIELFGATARNFRTTFATLAIAAGIDVKTTQGLMGHSRSKMTLDVYAKVDTSRFVPAITKLSKFVMA